MGGFWRLLGSIVTTISDERSQGRPEVGCPYSHAFAPPVSISAHLVKTRKGRPQVWNVRVPVVPAVELRPPLGVSALRPDGIARDCPALDSVGFVRTPALCAHARFVRARNNSDLADNRYHTRIPVGDGSRGHTVSRDRCNKDRTGSADRRLQEYILRLARGQKQEPQE